MRNTKITTPVLLLAFNRPEKTQQVFDSIRLAKPQKLYVALDGPREGRQDDVDNRNKVKAIVENVDWPCEPHYLIHEKNLGCSRSGYEAWKWAFDKEERLIFIEDDGLGNESAFYFVQEMLNKYANDERVAYVGGVNYGPTYGDASYFFSRLPAATYFMGTWKRVFEKYEYEIDTFNSTRWKHSFMKNFNTVGEYIIECAGFKDYLDSIKQGKRLNTYDCQMIYLSYKYNMYSIYPNVNMVSNIGLDGGANNHVSVDDDFYKEYANRKRDDLIQIEHPSGFIVNKSFEKKFYQKRRLFGESRLTRVLRTLEPKWIHRIRKTIIR
jgi:hypothetical protein